MSSSLPHLSTSGGSHALVVRDEARLFLGGQVHNSVPSSPAHVADAFAAISALGANTVIGSAAWSQVEPEEGHFDFSTVDTQIAEAKANHLQLVLIWFGAFKNAGSTYTPRWVRGDTERFPRAEFHSKPVVWTYDGQTAKPVLSVFGAELRAADQRAFVAFVRHLAATDVDHVVSMVQVENEMGVLGDSRDRCEPADAAWATDVPAALLDHLAERGDLLRPELAEAWERQGRPSSGTWAAVFGDDWRAHEIFMAWGFASYVEALAEAGKREHPILMYVNCWLGPQPGQPKAGDYPSGGPTVGVLDVWKACAPSIDFIGPDIYVDDAKSAMADYHRDDNPLFVPEAQLSAGSLFYALGRHAALGFSVFGVEDVRPDGQFAAALRVLGSIQTTITRAQAEGRIVGILLDDETPLETVTMGPITVTARGSRDLLAALLLDAGVPTPPPTPTPPVATVGTAPHPILEDGRPFGVLIQESDEEFLLVGQGLTLDFSATTGRVELDHVEEGRFSADGTWQAGRVLNGDERLYFVPLDAIGAARIRLLTTP